MKKLFLATLIALSHSAFAFNVPKPIEGHPSIITKQFSSSTGNHTFKLNLPKEWGIGQMSVSKQDPLGYFELFPVGGGEGCTIEIQRYEDEHLLKVAYNDLKKTAKPKEASKSGFEMEFPKGWFSCQLQANHLMKIWYVVSKKKGAATDNWNNLKNTLVIAEKKINKNEPYARVTEEEFTGYWCHHTDNKLHVLFKSFPLIKCKINNDEKLSHYLSFSDFKASGYFFIKWDQNNLSEQAPYQAHLDDMRKEISQLVPNQKTEKEPSYNVSNGYALLKGSPYNLLTVSGDGFLFGFAIKPESFMSVQLNNYIDCVKWRKD